MSTLKIIRDNKQAKIDDETNKYLNYTFPHSAAIIARVIKKQNQILLNWIADKKNLNKEQKQELFDKFLKVNYYCPKIVTFKKLENE